MKHNLLQRGGLWVGLQGLLLFAVLFFGLYSRGSWKSHRVTALGAGFLAIAAVCGISGAIALGRSLTPFPRPLPEARLVQTGIYRLLRHPLYTAVFCASVGWALVWASAPALAAALLLGPFFDAKAHREERWLRERFPDYAGYERRVRRFIPWVY